MEKQIGLEKTLNVLKIKYRDQGGAQNQIPTVPHLEFDGIDFMGVTKLNIEINAKEMGATKMTVEFLPLMIEQSIIVGEVERVVELDGKRYRLVEIVEEPKGA